MNVLTQFRANRKVRKDLGKTIYIMWSACGWPTHAILTKKSLCAFILSRIKPDDYIWAKLKQQFDRILPNICNGFLIYWTLNHSNHACAWKSFWKLSRFKLVKPQCRSLPIVHKIRGIDELVFVFITLFLEVVSMFHVLAPLTRILLGIQIKWEELHTFGASSSGRLNLLETGMSVVAPGEKILFCIIFWGYILKKQNSWAICPTKIIND